MLQIHYDMFIHHIDISNFFSFLLLTLENKQVAISNVERLMDEAKELVSLCSHIDCLMMNFSKFLNSIT